MSKTHQDRHGRMYRLVSAEKVRPGEHVIWDVPGCDYVVGRVEPDRIGGVRHHNRTDTASNCYRLGEKVRIQINGGD